MNLLSVFLPVVMAATVQSATMSGPDSCFPSCDPDDGRMLSIVGDNLASLTGNEIVLQIESPGYVSQFEIAIFDGDTSGTWDLGPGGTRVGAPLQFSLLADNGDVVGQWSGENMPDNDWAYITVSNDARAQTESGNYFYVLKVATTDATSSSWSNFKVGIRNGGTQVATIAGEAFQFTAPLFGAEEGFIIYPNGPGDLASTTYDGTWQLYFQVPPGADHVEVWDGDFDRGSFDNTNLDTDDPDTEGIPTWNMSPATQPEGIATVPSCSTESSITSCPADDRSVPVFVRSPSVEYTVIMNDGQSFYNSNPSGNIEWERFRIDTAPYDTAEMDYHTDNIASGTAGILVAGVDLSNLNAWQSEYPICAQSPCVPLPRVRLSGCTPGFWKQQQHIDSWILFQPDDSFSDIFGVPYDKTLLEALQTGGGGKRALARHAVAALLNISNDSVDYAYTLAQLIDIVQRGWETPEAAKDLFEVQNESGCVLN